MPQAESQYPIRPDPVTTLKSSDEFKITMTTDKMRVNIQNIEDIVIICKPPYSIQHQASVNLTAVIQ